MDVEWRSHPVTTLEFLQRRLGEGKKMSPIFSVFGVFASLFKVDWLHCADLGVAADFLGNLFCLLVPKMPGSTKAERASHFWKEIEQYYVDWGIEDRLDSFSYDSFSGSAEAPPKLKGSAAQNMALVRFGYLMARKHLKEDNPIEQAAKVAAHSLHQCYQSLSSTKACLSREVFLESSMRFAAQFYALFLAVGDGVSWRVMPKMHLFLELCSECNDPTLFWCYRDEDFGSTVAKQCKMKGSWRKLLTFSAHALTMFRMKNDVPRFLQAF